MPLCKRDSSIYRTHSTECLSLSTARNATFCRLPLRNSVWHGIATKVLGTVQPGPKPKTSNRVGNSQLADCEPQPIAQTLRRSFSCMWTRKWQLRSDDRRWYKSTKLMGSSPSNRLDDSIAAALRLIRSFCGSAHYFSSNSSQFDSSSHINLAILLTVGRAVCNTVHSEKWRQNSTSLRRNLWWIEINGFSCRQSGSAQSST